MSPGWIPVDLPTPYNDNPAWNFEMAKMDILLKID